MYTHIHIYAYTRTHASIYMYVCMYLYRRHNFQTGIGRELGENFSQLKKAGKEMEGGKEEKGENYMVKEGNKQYIEIKADIPTSTLNVHRLPCLVKD